jgi:hypothetical protein
MKIEPTFFDKHGAAARYAISVRSLDYARSRGDLAFYRHGRKVLFSEVDLTKYMSRFRVDVTEAEARP